MVLGNWKVVQLESWQAAQLASLQVVEGLPLVSMPEEVPGTKAVEAALQHWFSGDQQAFQSSVVQQEPLSLAAVPPS